MDRIEEVRNNRSNQAAIEAVISRRIVFPVTPVRVEEEDPVTQAAYGSLRDQDYNHDEVVRLDPASGNQGANF